MPNTIELDFNFKEKNVYDLLLKFANMISVVKNMIIFDACSMKSKIVWAEPKFTF